MIRILAAIGALCIFCSVLLALFIVAHIVRSRSDPYPPEAAEAPKACPCGAQDQYDHAPSCLDEHFKTAPREQRIDEAEVDRLVEAFDWPRYATWLKEPS